MGMLACLRAVGIRIVFDRSAGVEDHGTTPGSLASATCMLPLGRIFSHRNALITRPEQARAGLVARLTGPMILVFTMVVGQCARAEDACIDPSTLTATTVSITRYFTADEKPQPSLDGYRATAWFYGSTRYLVSIAHFVDEAPVVPRGEWRKVDLRQRDVTVEVSARLLAVVRALPEGFAIFELREPFPNAQPLRLREKPLSRNEPVRSIAYLGGLRFAKGRFAEIAGSNGNSDMPRDHPFAKVRPGSALFEMWDIDERNNDRFVLDHGASGAPIVDCDGNVAAVASSIVTQGSFYFAGREIKLTTPWGIANNTAALIQPLFDITLTQ
jgi:Trypsin-like peptidase domain